MTDMTTTQKRNDGPILWVNTLFLSLSPILAMLLIPIYLWYSGSHWALWASAFVMWLFSGLGITIGYHRLFAHRSYEGSAPWRFLSLVAGASALQNSAIVWAASHRRHHRHTDHEGDPYDATRGFWWAHMKWIFHDNDQVDDLSNVPDLKADPLVVWQQKWYWVIALMMNVAVPLGLGLLIGRPWGMLLFAGLARIVFTHQATFSINSLCHILGTQPWSENNTSRDSWICAYLTFGEGYHNFHHTFPADYRNGLRWYHFDPAKWAIWTGNKLGLTSNLKRTEAPIQWRKRLERQTERYETSLSMVVPETNAEWSQRVESARQQVDKHLTRWAQNLREYQKACREGQVTATLLLSLREARRAWRQAWKEFLALEQALPLPV
ncbi:MAG: fatty acid desaturase [Planctomycetota bacterium]|nr:fatty acid desaturase [Planctomycetota bacterium]